MRNVWTIIVDILTKTSIYTKKLGALSCGNQIYVKVDTATKHGISSDLDPQNCKELYCFTVWENSTIFSIYILHYLLYYMHHAKSSQRDNLSECSYTCCIWVALVPHQFSVEWVCDLCTGAPVPWRWVSRTGRGERNGRVPFRHGPCTSWAGVFWSPWMLEEGGKKGD